MNYYERHIGDYLKDTAHLSLLEHGIYTRLLDVYYTKEVGIEEGMVARLIGARSEDELAALRVVLMEFFVLEGGIYLQARCDREIGRYQDKQRKAKASADARWSHTGRNANALPTQSEGNAPSLQSPVSIPKEEKGKRKRSPSFDAEAIELPEWLGRELWCEWCRERRTRGKAITERGAVEQLKSLAEYRSNGHAPARVIGHAIASGNQGLFPPPVVRGVAGAMPEAKVVEVWKPPAPLTTEERIASQRAKELALSSIKIIRSQA